MIESGKVVSWSYQASGVTYSKKGKIVATVNPDESADSVIALVSDATYEQKKFKDFSTTQRYLIEVKESDKVFYYAPLTATVDKCNVTLANFYKLQAAQAELTAQLKKAEDELSANEAKEYSDRCVTVFASLKELLVDNNILFKDAINYLQEEAGLIGPPLGTKPFEAKPITYKGETMSIHAWAKKMNMPYARLYQRLTSMGWTVEEAFETPVSVKKSKRVKVPVIEMA